MSQAAHERAVVAQAEEIARIEAESPHCGHHQHLRGAMVLCSCGVEFGVTCVIPGDVEPENQSCRECGARGVILLG